MNIYLIERIEQHEGIEIIAAFSTYEKALAKLQELNLKASFNFWYDIKEMELI